ncbi:MAG: ABC transporter [Sandaracinus sp.]|nr:ABC transporter [Sandaracinus sp.]
MSPLRRLMRYGAPHRSQVRKAIAWSVLNKLFDLAPPVLIGAAIDVVVQGDESLVARLGVEGTMPQLTVLAVATVIIWGLESVFEFLEKVGWRNLAQTVQHELRLDVYAHVQGLELAYFEDRSTGGLMAVLNDDINQLERFLDGGANEVLQVMTTVVAVGAVFFGLAPWLALWAFCPVPVVLWGSFLFQRRIAPRYQDVRERVAHLNGQLANNLGGIATIKSFTAEAHEVERVRQGSDAYRESNRSAIKLSSAFSPLIRMAIVVGFTATLVYGGYLAEKGDLAVGSYGVLVFLTQRLLWPLTRLGSTFDLYQRAMASTRRALDLLATEPELVDGDQDLPEPVQGDVVFDGVTFAYVPGHPIVRDLDLRMPAGETTAIVGSTGSGKSTVVKLLLRFYDPGQGQVRVDGVDLRELRMADLRQHIGLVSQDVFLFHGTVRENIAYGSFDASDEAIREAARIAEAHEFIETLPEGYDTVVGERGQKLSGGQRQRLSIARAVLKDPPILILDEATSAVDNETEAAIQRSLARIAEGRTTIIIAHRLSTVRHAHRIHVLAQGQVAEAGTHEELLARDGLYANLWSVQTGETASAAE